MNNGLIFDRNKTENPDKKHLFFLDIIMIDAEAMGRVDEDDELVFPLLPQEKSRKNPFLFLHRCQVKSVESSSAIINLVFFFQSERRVGEGLFAFLLLL